MDNMFNFSSDNVCCECGKPAEMGVCEGCQIGPMDNYTALQNVGENNQASEKKIIDYINDSYNQIGGRMSRKTAAGMYDKMDSLIQAINRLAESQEKQNALFADSIVNSRNSLEINRQSLELNTKQYALNIDNHQFNREQAEKAENPDLLQAIKDYVDEAFTHAQERINESNQKTNEGFTTITQAMNIINKTLALKADKADEKEIAESIWKRISRNARTRTDGLPPKR